MIKGISFLFSSSLVSQLIPFLVLPLLTTLYTPEQFGVYSGLVAISSVALVMSMGRYEQAQVQIIDRWKRNAVFEVCIVLLLSFSILLGCIVFIFGFFEGYEIVPLLVFLYGLYFLCEKKFNSEESYQDISVQKILRSVFEAASAVIIASYAYTEYGMILGLIIGLSVSIIYALSRINYNFAQRPFLSYISVVKEYKNFPLFNMPHALIGSLVSYLPIILIPLFYDNETLGFYALGMKVAQTPISILSASLYSVFYPVLAKAYVEKNNIHSRFKKIFQFQLIFVLIAILVIVISEDTFIWIFTSQWESSYGFIVMMLPSIFMTFIIVPYSSVTNIFFKQKQALCLEVVFTFVRVLSFCLGAVYFTAEYAIFIFSVVSMICMLINLAWYYSFTRYTLALEHD